MKLLGGLFLLVSCLDWIPNSHAILCPQNEVWDDCVQNVCLKYCGQVGFPLDCTEVPPSDCEGGCICKTGYLRNSKGKCIKINDCKYCAYDPNAIQGCSNYCRHSCDDYLDKDKDCPPGCIYNGCRCRKGYVYDKISKRCMLPKDCPKKICKDPHAEVVLCATLCPPTCDNPGPPKKICKCVKYGCACKHGYILDKPGGICIRVKDCPKCRPCNGDPHAVIQYCPTACPLTCARPWPVSCILPCPNAGCVCRDGYIKETTNGDCILQKDCPEDEAPQPIDDGENEDGGDDGGDGESDGDQD